MVRPNGALGSGSNQSSDDERAVKSNAMKQAQAMADEVTDYKRRKLEDARSLSVTPNVHKAWGFREVAVVELSNRRGDMEPFLSVRDACGFIDEIARTGW